MACEVLKRDSATFTGLVVGKIAIINPYGARVKRCLEIDGAAQWSRVVVEMGVDE